MTVIMPWMPLIRGQKTRISRRMTSILGQMILILLRKTEIFLGKALLFIL